jgi:hypothetical protein
VARLIALLIALCMASSASAGSISGGRIQGGGMGIPWLVEPPSDFVTLAASTLYGFTSPTVFDYASRVSTPEPIPLPNLALWATYAQETSMRDDICSTGESTTTWDAYTALVAAASVPTVIWLPDNCRVRHFLRPNTGGNTVDYTLNKDYIITRCADGAPNCGFLQILENTDIVYPGADSTPETADPEWDFTRGNISRLSNQARGIGIGGTLPYSGPAIPADRLLDWGDGSAAGMAANYSLGSYLLDIQEDIRTTGATGTFVGPGDIIRVMVNPVPNGGTNGFQHITRVKCVDGMDDSGGSNENVDQLGENCRTGLGKNMIEMVDPLPMDYADGSYHWGDTVGHRVEILERVGSGRCGIVGGPLVCGTGTQTTTMAEGVAFYKVKWDRIPYYTGETGAGFFQILNAFDTVVYRNDFERAVGGSVFTIGSGSSDTARVGRTLLFGNIFRDDPWKVICFAEVVQVFAENPARVRLYNSGCGFDDLANNSRIGFSNDVAEPFLRGKTFKMTSFVNDGGSPSTVTVTIGGLDGTASGGWGAGVGGALLTAGGGTAGELDDFAHALYYCIKGASNTQLISNALLGTNMGWIVEAGCTSHVAFGNWSLHGARERTERADFHHSNANAPGSHTEQNDLDISITVYASSVTQAGEGLHNTKFKNRGRNTAVGGITPWAGADARGRGTIDFAEQSNQRGATNEFHNFFENAWQEIANATSKMDCSDNTPPSGSSACTASEPPYMLKSMGWHRSRLVAAGANLDDNFDLFGFDATPNPTTATDVTGSNLNGTLYEDDQIPLAYSAAASAGQVPTSILYDAVPSWFPGCTGGTATPMTFGEMGASYDDFTVPLKALPIQTLIEGGTCPGIP